MTAALVVAPGHSLWHDLVVIQGAGVDPLACLVVAVNRGGVFWPGPVDYWATRHPDQLPGWLTERAKRHRGWPRPRIVTDGIRPGAVPDLVIPATWRGSSGLYGVQTALVLGGHPVLVAGMPLDGGGYADGSPPHQDYEPLFRKHWTARAADLRGRVYAPSGWLRTLLGWPPPKETQQCPPSCTRPGRRTTSPP